ncbi:MAG: hypothetical protein U0S36_10495 [Candidatus Nanopelagicales bacterium]
MHDAMVGVAEQEHVGRIGEAVVLPLADVVGVASVGGDAAAGELAVLVTDQEGPAQPWGCGATGAADVEDLAGCVAEPGVRVRALDAGDQRTADRRAQDLLVRRRAGADEDGGDIGVAEVLVDRSGGDGLGVEAGQVQVAAEAGAVVRGVDGDQDVGALLVLGAELPGVEEAFEDLGERDRVQVGRRPRRERRARRRRRRWAGPPG